MKFKPRSLSQVGSPPAHASEKPGRAVFLLKSKAKARKVYKAKRVYKVKETLDEFQELEQDERRLERLEEERMIDLAEVE
jgi:hypothetical protein